MAEIQLAALAWNGLDASNWAIWFVHLSGGWQFLDYSFLSYDFSDFATTHLVRGSNRLVLSFGLDRTAFPWFLILLQKSFWVAKTRPTHSAHILGVDEWSVLFSQWSSVQTSALYPSLYTSGLAFWGVLAWDQLFGSRLTKMEIVHSASLVWY